MWVKAKKYGTMGSSVVNIIGAYISNNDLMGNVIDTTYDNSVLLGSYESEDKAEIALERIMMAIVNNGKLVDLSREF